MFILHFDHETVILTKQQSNQMISVVIISRGAEGPGREILQRPPSVRPSVRHV